MELDLLRSFFDARLLAELGIALGLISAGTATLWLLYSRSYHRLTIGLLKDAVWASKHLKMNAGFTDYYFDADLYLAEPSNIRAALGWSRKALRETAKSGRIDYLAFLEKDDGPVGVLTMKDLISFDAKLPTAILRFRRTGPALRVKASIDEGETKLQGLALSTASGERGRVVIFSDVLTTGTTIRKAAHMIGEAGGEAVAALVLYDREEPFSADEPTLAREVLAKAGTPVTAMMRHRDMRHEISHNKLARGIAQRKGVDFVPVNAQTKGVAVSATPR